MDLARPQEPDAFSDEVRDILRKVAQWHFGEFCPVESWSPAVNLYQVRSQLVLCMDLAGVKPEDVEVQVEARRVVVRGVRVAPDPRRSGQAAMRIVSMEIDHGSFCRLIDLPMAVNPAGAQTQYRDGLLWVAMPLRSAR